MHPRAVYISVTAATVVGKDHKPLYGVEVLLCDGDRCSREVYEGGGDVREHCPNLPGLLLPNSVERGDCVAASEGMEHGQGL